MANVKKENTDQTAVKTYSTAKPRVIVNRLSDSSVEIKIVVPWGDVEKVRKEVVDKLAQTVTVPGLRPEKAPKNVASAKIPKEKVQEEMLKIILTNEYTKAVKDNDIKPIINPKIHIEAFEEGTPLEFEAMTCEEPIVELGNYKDAIKKITAPSKIVLPGKDPSASSGQEKIPLDDVLKAALSATTTNIPHVLVEQETNRLLSQLLDEIKRLGVSLDQYLASRSKNSDQLRTEYEEKAKSDIKLEFMLRKIADTEKIVVEQKDIETALATIEDQNQRKEIAQNPYMLAGIIRQQKTLDFLSKL